jgi:hypothetical protein
MRGLEREEITPPKVDVAPLRAETGPNRAASRTASRREARSTAALTVVAGRCGALSEYGTGLGVPVPSPWYQFSPAPASAYPTAPRPPGASWWMLMNAAPVAPIGVTRPGVARAATPARRRRVTTARVTRVVKAISEPSGPEAPVWAR